MTTFEKDNLENLLAIFAALVAEHFDGIDPFQIQMEDETKELLFDDQDKFGAVIEDILQFYQIKVAVDLSDVFSTFPKVEDVVRFIAVNMES